MEIHKTAIIDPNAELGEGNYIGPNVVIDKNVKLGNNNWIGPGAIITGYTTIGNNNRIFGHAYIGAPPQDVAFKDDETYVKIGDNNIIREFSTIHRGTAPGSTTIIGNNNFLMVGAHVAHNCKIGSNIVMVNCASLGGYVEVDDYAFLGGFVIVHQFTRIGSYTMCGILTKITKDVPPFMLVDGNPATVYGVNIVGLRRRGFSAERRLLIQRAYKILYRERNSLKTSLEKLNELAINDKNGDIKILIDFIEKSKRGILLKSNVK